VLLRTVSNVTLKNHSKYWRLHLIRLLSADTNCYPAATTLTTEQCHHPTDTHSPLHSVTAPTDTHSPHTHTHTHTHTQHAHTIYHTYLPTAKWIHSAQWILQCDISKPTSVREQARVYKHCCFNLHSNLEEVSSVVTIFWMAWSCNQAYMVHVQW